MIAARLVDIAHLDIIIFLPGGPKVTVQKKHGNTDTCFLKALGQAQTTGATSDDEDVQSGG
jgi:hypothetical protein